MPPNLRGEARTGGDPFEGPTTPTGFSGCGSFGTGSTLTRRPGLQRWGRSDSGLELWLEMGEGECETVEAPKKGRHRKKQLYNSILHQMEFYFSDSNLSKDRYLSQLISENPYVDISVFLKFNKIRKLNCSIEDIQKAISKSDLIELSEDKEKICRKKPVKVKENVDECTIYVENIKADANHDFSEFGTVVYVSVPKYKQNKGNKGFAFVEFDTEKEALNALSYFESIGCRMPSEMNPEDLKSITTFEGNVTAKEELNTTNDANEQITDENSKKRKLSESDTDTNIDKKLKIDIDLNNMSTGDNENETVEPGDTAETENKKKKKSKKEKKRSYIKELGLQILSKKEWKKMRNKYLDLQKKKMKEFKKYLHKQQHKKTASDKFNKAKDESHAGAAENSEADILPKLEFTPGLIVKLVLPEQCMDVKKLKTDVKALSSDIKYVDIPPTGSEEVYIRFANSESAKEFCNIDFPGQRTVLENEDEKIYWDKIQNDRNVKLSKCVKKQRGRDKLLKKAEKERAKHLRFDEGE
ncbi:hypothetical protein NQ315_004666 [Exocentrus adspersus]|uniref:Uncharacterized protein n=1 Tax=Exocentrus adspersus TaxID=1586481 RepID=A0AAV8VNV9_9CUCU|nr:hypothetical protein NQ315_004666 [Exocentrus adspersus]